MSRLAASEAHLDFDLVPLFEKSAGCAHAHLQVMIVRTGAQADLFDFRDVLILFGVTRALVLLEFEFAKIGDAAHGWVGGRGDFDQV